MLFSLFIPFAYAADGDTPPVNTPPTDASPCSWAGSPYNTDWIKGDTCSCKSWYTRKSVPPTVPGEFQYICEECDIEKCNCGVKLNTNIPFIGPCIVYGETNTTNDPSGDENTIVVNPLNAFPVLMWWLVKILMTAIILLSFGTLIAAGVMMTVPGQYETGKNLIWKVVYTIALLGVSGTILYLVNPNFFF